MNRPTVASTTAERIERLATALRLPTVRRAYRALADQAGREGGDYLAFLAEVLQAEVDDREDRRVERRIKEARFPQVKLLSELDFTAAAMPPRALVMDLAAGTYIAEGRNVIALGNSGTGKTHLATGLAVQACQEGLRVRFYTVATLAAELEAAAQEHVLHRFLGRLGRWDLLVLDELGYLPLSRSAAELLFQAVGERHERCSTIITSNLPFSDWTEVFHTERLTAALLDRVTHRATILEMNGPSFRLGQSLQERGLYAAAEPPRTARQ